MIANTMKGESVVCVAIVLAWFAVPAQCESQEKTEQAIYYDHLKAPDTLDQLMESVELVVRATALRSVPKVAVRPTGSKAAPDVFTAVDFRILEIIKGTPRSISPILTASLLTGSAEVGGRMIVARSSERVPRPDAEVVLFLKWSPLRESYVLAYGGAGLFELTPDSEVRVPVTARHIVPFAFAETLHREYFLQIVRRSAAQHSRGKR